MTQGSERTVLRGVVVAMTTPFADDESFDAGRCRDHIDMLIDAGVHGIVMNSGTGEFAYLSDAEALQILEVGAAHIAGRVPVVAQTSTRAEPSRTSSSTPCT